MAQEILKGIAEDVGRITKRIVEARDLLTAMREAGEDTAKLETRLRDLETRKLKWQRMLEGRGFTIK